VTRALGLSGAAGPRFRIMAVPIEHRGSGNGLLQLASIEGGFQMSGSVYKVIELVGTSTESWEAAARAALEAAAEHVQDLRVAEVVRTDVRLADNKIVEYRVKMNVSFKYHAELSD